ncbi:hypothetical protein [Nereida sp. MMG025]|uniref:hypothetical protein n=1 Tax=Nereida sp. MMG025 TaxID=2909981 RepID=UPI001F229FE8|nr:hypothetical protein [Nereida sp. MMG025]MCF6444452.1 hypothetical protein [Nereida sp. MMG025]
MRFFPLLLLPLVLACQPAQSPKTNDAKAQRDAERVVRLVAADPLLGNVPQICPIAVYDKKPSLGASGTDCTTNPKLCLEQCNLGDDNACFDVAQVIENGGLTGDGERTYSLYIAGCALGDANACVNAGATVKNGSWANQAPKAAASAKCQFQTYRRMCDDGAAWGCYMVAAEYLRTDGFVAQSDAKYEAALRRACQISSTSGACSDRFR